MTVNAPSRMVVGVSQPIDIAIHRPATVFEGSSADVGHAPQDVRRRDGDEVLMVFEAGRTTVVTLDIQADSFEFAAPPKQERRSGGPDIAWTVNLTPRQPGNQAIVLTVIQEIKGVEIDPLLHMQALDTIRLQVDPVDSEEDSDSMLGGLGSLSTWMIAVVIIPLVPVLITLIGRDAILAWYRRTFRRP